jgi:hypothetical protein
VLLGEEVIPKLGVLVHALIAHRLGEIPDTTTYLCIQLRPCLRRRRDLLPGTIEVPAVWEGDVGVFYTLVGLPERLSHSYFGTYQWSRSGRGRVTTTRAGHVM